MVNKCYPRPSFASDGGLAQQCGTLPESSCGRRQDDPEGAPFSHRCAWSGGASGARVGPTLKCVQSLELDESMWVPVDQGSCRNSTAGDQPAQTKVSCNLIKSTGCMSGQCSEASRQRCAPVLQGIPQLCTFACLDVKSGGATAVRACSKCVLQHIAGTANNTIENTLFPCCSCLPSLGEDWGLPALAFRQMLLSTCGEHSVLDDDDRHSDDDFG